jgi:hypothetical protein
MKSTTKAPSAKPYDVSYRLNRARQCAEEAGKFMSQILPEAFADGHHEAVLAKLTELQDLLFLASTMAPAKKSSKSLDDEERKAIEEEASLSGDVSFP